jgi:MarR family transcriptional regulator, transcriptional regulator for hemolysin
MSRLRASVILELHTADRLVRTLMLEEMARLGLQPNLLAILALIGLHQPITPRDLALESGVRPTTMRDFVNEMVAAGHVRRVANPDDRRSHFLELTPEGEEFARSASRAVDNVQRDLERRLGTPIEELRDPLRRLRHAAREALSAN